MANQKVIVSERDNIAALFEDDRATEFIIHRGDTLLGDVYLATVENILPSIDAAFVNVGGNKMGFLHSSDVKGRGDLKGRLKPGEKMVVQVIKEPTGHKGPRVTTNISLPGRFLVFMPDSKGISISRKIEDPEERSRLKAIVSMSKPHGVGVIIRTEAQGQKESDLTEDFETLLDRWQNIVTAADASSKHTLLYRDQDLLYRVIREIVTDDVNEIVVDTAFGQQRAQQLLQTWNLDKGVKVTQYQGKQSIMIGTGLEREIKLALQTKVPLPSGGYLFIQPTEALTVVDVNSGKFTSLSSQAETIRLTNLESCKEIARQLRLRNIGGMIVVDFIDMESRADQLSILETFDKELQPDKAKPQMGQLTDLGLVEMTRHRQGQSLNEIFTKDCPTCQGRAHVHEIFNWAPANAEEESKMFGRGGNRFQQRRGQRGGRGTRDKNEKTGRGRGGKSQQGSKDGKPESQQDVAEVQVPRLKPTKRSLLLDKKKQLDPKQIDEHYKHLMARQYGSPLAQGIFAGYTPEKQNRILARINSKANSVPSLVASLVVQAQIHQRAEEERAEAEAKKLEQAKSMGKIPPVGSSMPRSEGALGEKPTDPPSSLSSASTPASTAGPETKAGIPSFLSSLFKGSGKPMLDAQAAAAELAKEQNMEIKLPDTTPASTTAPEGLAEDTAPVENGAEGTPVAVGATAEAGDTDGDNHGSEQIETTEKKTDRRRTKTASRAKSRARTQTAATSEESSDASSLPDAEGSHDAPSAEVDAKPKRRGRPPKSAKKVEENEAE